MAIKITVDTSKLETDLNLAIEEIEKIPNEVINEVSDKYANKLKEQIKNNFESSYIGYQTGATIRQLTKKSDISFGRANHRIGFFGNRAYIAFYNEYGTSRMSAKHFMERAVNDILPDYLSELKSKLK